MSKPQSIIEKRQLGNEDLIWEKPTLTFGLSIEFEFNKTNMKMETSEKDNKYFRAKDRVDCIKKFYTSLISYVFFIAFLAGINYWTDEWRYPWFLWAAFGWGIGLVFQAIKAFGLNPFFGRDWEDRKIKEYMKDDEKQRRWK